jgi:hypothetical protein
MTCMATKLLTNTRHSIWRRSARRSAWLLAATSGAAR